jgi:ABC-type transport system involved in cytochrome c biogenesis permease subunit
MTGKMLPWGMIALGALWIFADLQGPSDAPGQLRIHDFGKIPVVNNGRIKPMDTIARTHLRIVANRETFRDKDGKSHPAIEWLLDVEAEFTDKEQRARKHPVFRIDHPQLIDALGLQPREGYRYSIDDFAERLTSIAEPLKTAHDRKESGHPLDAYENQLFEFERHLGFYERLSRLAIPHVIPPKGKGEWKILPDAVPKDGSAVLDRDVESWKQMLQAYGSKDGSKFNEAVDSYLKRMEAERPEDVHRVSLESRFNYLDPFNKCKWLYLIGGLLTCLSWMGWRSPLNWSAWGLLVLTFAVHTSALVVRIYLSGRPPVTNLYSSAVFIGWGAAFIGLIMALILRQLIKNDVVMSIGSVAASVSGFSTLQIAHILAAEGDTMEVLQAVLDTQFWLSTHVTCITLGYATTYMAGLVGAIYIVMGVFSRALSPEIAKGLNRITYGLVCFATFFSFVGTVLGGLWADDSWGRFWGWDPKENGALMIVLWNAIVLHSRWGGLVRERGLSVLGVLGNIVVSWSWFGVNQLGVGLHSYGFTSGITVTLALFCISQLAIAGCGMIPPQNWGSKLGLKGAHASENNGSDHA